MPGEYYSIPENPVYNSRIPKLQSSDPADADLTFNPLIQQLINNQAFVKKQMDASGPQLRVFASSGSTVVCTDGVSTLTATAGGSEIVTFPLPNFGVWTATATDTSGESVSTTFVVDSAKQYGKRLSGATVFGVECDYNNPSTAMRRLTPANDPMGYVTEEVIQEPSPAIGTGAGSSPFDAYSPWSGMDEYNIIDGAASYKRGSEGFSRTDYDTMVYIPSFYYAIVDDATTAKRRLYVSDAEKDGFALHPGSGRYVGRYMASGDTDANEESITSLNSVSGQDPLSYITRSMARAGAAGKGDNWQQYDFATYCAIVLLFAVEFADWDSQKVVGAGISENILTSVQASGLTDSMTYHTGRAAGEDERTCQVQYRHIEGIWGNMFQFVDGINFTDRAAYVCLNSANFADDTTENYTATGITLPTTSYIKRLGVSSTLPWCIIPDEGGGSSSTYIPDRVVSNTGWRILYVGGGYNGTGGYVGLLFFLGVNASTFASASIGSRLLYVP